MSRSTRSKRLHRLRKIQEETHLPRLKAASLNPWSRARARAHNTNSQLSSRPPLTAFTPLCPQFKNQAYRRHPVSNSKASSHCNLWSLKNRASRNLIQWHKSHQECQRLSSRMGWALISRTTVWSRMRSPCMRASPMTSPTKAWTNQMVNHQFKGWMTLQSRSLLIGVLCPCKDPLNLNNSHKSSNNQWRRRPLNWTNTRCSRPLKSSSAVRNFSDFRNRTNGNPWTRAASGS